LPDRQDVDARDKPGHDDAAGETLHAAIIRAVREETALTIEPAALALAG
jgi:ADP-ribose pyrophosphatase YjhB (NUDIX family)